jgi:hypothetical protein
MPSSTRPVPVGGFFTETSTDRIHMHVLDGGLDGFGMSQISIVARALLPKSKSLHSRSLPNCEPLQEWASVLFQKFPDSIRIRPFDGPEQFTHAGFVFDGESSSIETIPSFRTAGQASSGTRRLRNLRFKTVVFIFEVHRDWRPE